MACLSGEPYLFCVRARASCVRTHYPISFYDDVGGDRECLSGGALPPISKTYCTLNARAVKLKTMPYLFRAAR